MTQQTTAERIFDLILSATQAWTQDEAAEQIAAEIDALTRERDYALAETSRLGGQLAEARAEIDALTRERDEARAEVERLRPAAEAWRTLEDFREAERTGTLSDEKRTRKIHETARDAARARAAKGAA